MWNAFRFCPRARLAKIMLRGAVFGLAGWLGAGVWAQTTTSQPSSNDERCQMEACAGDEVEPASPESEGLSLPSADSQADSQSKRGDADARPARVKANRPEEHGAPTLLPPEPDSEFQRYVYRSGGVHLRLYGRSFFQHIPDGFVSQDQIPVPAGYTLGAGDQILIHVWGQVDLKALVTVDRNGQIYLPKIGMITVAGVRYDQLHDYLHNAIRQWFKDFELNVSLGQLHSVEVYVVGHARRPGRYTVSALSTLVNALFYSGGPSASGSMRHIRLERQGRVVTEFDLYDLLLRGDNSKDAVLLPGDVILIPAIGPQVALFGSVNQPAIYELRGPTSIGDAIQETGGLSATADDTRASLERVDDRRQRRVEEFALDAGGLARPLQDGDVLRVYPVSPRFENAVTLRGPVAHPGRYPWHPGMHISDLVPSQEAVISEDYWVRQNALGESGRGWIAGPAGTQNARDGSQKKADESGSHFYPKDQDADAEAANVGKERQIGEDQAAGQNEDTHKLGPHRTEIEQDYAGINWDYAVVQRLDSKTLSSRLLPFSLRRVLEDAASPDNLSLEPNDVVTIFSQRDMQVPVEQRDRFVWVEGEVEAAGVYRMEPGETLRQAVARAGGLSPQAYLFGADFRRESARREQQQSLQRILQETDQQLRSQGARLAASGSAEERQAGQEQMEYERGMVERLTQTQPTGRIVLDLKPGDRDLGALPDLPLEDGDRITIPPRSATVEVAGAVYNRNSFIFRPGKTVADYLRLAGGPTPDADSARLFVIRADGSVLSKQMHRGIWGGNFEALALTPGDTLVMPERIRTGSLLRGIRDWSQVFSQFALGAAAIKVIGP